MAENKRWEMKFDPNELLRDEGTTDAGSDLQVQRFDLLSLAEIHERIERIMRGEQLEREETTAPAEAGQVPAWYGGRTAMEVSALWTGWMATAPPIDLPFYQAGAIGWASR